MKVTVSVPTVLQRFTNKQANVEIDATNIFTLIETLEKSYPGLRERLCDETGKIRGFLNFYINGEDIRWLDSQNSILSDGDEVLILPAISGG